MNTPNVYWIGQLINAAQSVSKTHPTLGMTPARPMGFQGIFWR